MLSVCILTPDDITTIRLNMPVSLEMLIGGDFRVSNLARITLTFGDIHMLMTRLQVVTAADTRPSYSYIFNDRTLLSVCI